MVPQIDTDKRVDFHRLKIYDQLVHKRAQTRGMSM